VRLGWRSWLFAAGLGLWLVLGVAALLILPSPNMTGGKAWPLTGVVPAGLLMPVFGLYLLWPRPVPPGLPSGDRFGRSRGWLLAYTLGMFGVFGVCLLLTPLFGIMVLDAALSAWTAGKGLKSLFFGVLAAALPVLILIAAAAVAWLGLRPAWHRRRWPFAIVGADALWIDGHHLDWPGTGPVRLVSTRSGTFIQLDRPDGSITVPLLALAGSGLALRDRIAAQQTGQR
jgi:hypothetical protein